MIFNSYVELPEGKQWCDSGRVYDGDAIGIEWGHDSDIILMRCIICHGDRMGHWEDFG